MELRTFRVDLVFEVRTTDYDPHRFARMAERFAQLLPKGSQTLHAKAADKDGLAAVAARVPAYTAARALHGVALALEMAASDEPAGLAGTLGDCCCAHVELVK